MKNSQALLTGLAHFLTIGWVSGKSLHTALAKHFSIHGGLPLFHQENFFEIRNFVKIDY